MQELAPPLENLAALPKELGATIELITDSGYFGETNVKACEDEEVTPFIAVDRQQHNQSVGDRFIELQPLPDGYDAVTKRSTGRREKYNLLGITLLGVCREMDNVLSMILGRGEVKKEMSSW